MTTLRRLVNSPRLGLNVLAGSDDLDRPLSWVAVSELDDPTPYLEGAELLLTTGVGREFDHASAQVYVGRLVEADVSGLGFGVGVSHELVPEQLVVAAERAGLPLIEVDRPTPFIAVSKELADLLAEERLERARRELAAMQSLTADLLGPGGAADVVSRLARLVQGWVVVLDARGVLIRSAAGDSRPEYLDQARHLAARLQGRGRHASAASSDPSGRVTALPLGLGEPDAGVLVVGTPAGVDRAAPQVLAFAASLLTLGREREPQPGSAAVVQGWARAAALAVRLGVAPPSPPAALTARAPGTLLRAAVLLAEPAVVAPRLAGCRPEGEEAPVLLALSDPDPATLAVLTEPVDEAVHALQGLRGGLSDPVVPGDLEDAVRAAHALARRAPRGLVRAADAPTTVQELLGPALSDFADALLAPLRRAAGGDVLVQTLRVWLGLHGQTVATAQALGVHRHTVRDRLRRSASLLGRDLDDPQARAELWLALMS